MRLIEDEQNNDSLPWVNEYINSAIGEEGDVSPIKSFKFGTKGILVITADFKGFIFKGTQTYSHITDALEHWRQDGRLPFRLYAQALSSGKVAVAIEDKEESIAVVDGKKSVDFKHEPEGTGDTGVAFHNPFTVGLPVPTTSGKGKRSTIPTTKAEM